MDSNKWTILTPILVALIPVGGAVLTYFLNVLNAHNPEPVVTVEKSISDLDSKVGLIQMKNMGGAPATNINAYVESNSKILNVSQTSFLEIKLPGFNNSVLPRDTSMVINNKSFEFIMPKLIQGEGGFSEIELKFDKPQEAEKYNVIAIYDQGSAAGKITPYFMKSNLWLFYTVTIIGEIIFLIYFQFIHKKRKFLKVLHSNLVRFRRKLLDDPENRKSLRLDWEPKSKKIRRSFRLPGKPEYIYSHYSWENAVINSRKYINNISDFIKVDDLFDLIFKREDKLNSDKIKILNYQILRSINDVLNQVDWNRYI